MYQRFTDRAKKVLKLAEEEARRFDHPYVGTVHILLGLIEEGSGPGANVLKNLSRVDWRYLRAEVEKRMETGPGDTLGELPKSPGAIKVIKYSQEESNIINADYVGTEHLLLGLLREQDGIAARVLNDVGLRFEEVSEEIKNLLGITK